MSDTTGQLCTAKEIAAIFQKKETDIRAIIAVFEVPVKGKGPKPARGIPSNLYLRSDFAIAFLAIENARKLMETIP